MKIYRFKIIIQIYFDKIFYTKGLVLKNGKYEYIIGGDFYEGKKYFL